jgi:hypothetical protein
MSVTNQSCFLAVLGIPVSEVGAGSKSGTNIGASRVEERQKLDWAYQEKKLLLLLAKQQALPIDCPSSLAELNKEITAVEELVNAYRLIEFGERLR